MNVNHDSRAGGDPHVMRRDGNFQNRAWWGQKVSKGHPSIVSSSEFPTELCKLQNLSQDHDGLGYTWSRFGTISVQRESPLNSKIYQIDAMLLTWLQTAYFVEQIDPCNKR